MADGRRYDLGARLDIDQIISEAQHRWLRPAEICEILRNYKKFQVAAEPGKRPPSGSLFLFDRKVLRYFRKDGHNWRKKEAHEKLKSGSIDVLQCYYAHGEENENFQRRSYWLLGEEASNIVLVHYLEVKGNRANTNRTREAAPNSLESGGNMSTSEVDSSMSSKFHSYSYPVASHTTDNSTQASEYEDAESASSHQSTSRHSSIMNLQPSVIAEAYDPLSIPYYPVPPSDDYDGRFEANSDMSFISLLQGEKNRNNLDVGLTYEFESTSTVTDGLEKKPELTGNPRWQHDVGYNNLPSRFLEDISYAAIVSPFDQQPGPLGQVADEDGGKPNPVVDEKPGSLKPPVFEVFMKEGLKKLDSFDRWMSSELGDVKESQSQSTSGTYWEAVESENGVDDSIISPQVHMDSYMLSPSISKDQLFSILDFSPNWAYTGSEIKVLITGRFLRSQQELQHSKWACMFGELEVPAEVVADGVLRCHTPDHIPGRVPFYVTCANRVACSEVREFEFKANEINNNSNQDMYDGDEMLTRFVKLLSLGSQNLETRVDDPGLLSQLNALIQEDNGMEMSPRDQVFEKLLKEKLYLWLVQKVIEGGKGASVLDEGGQGVLHFAGALGYDWAIPPTVAAGVSVNFRDVNGWTALHWAASCGRERTVGFLISQGAAAGAVTDPSLKYPTGRTPADLASSNGHKGIAGYCAAAAISSHLELLKLKDKTVQTVTERAPTPVSEEGLSLKDSSLAAVCNASLAAARIHQVFRVQSFQKKLRESGLSDEQALSLALKTTRPSQHEHAAAAVRIQNKFRSWKGRKDFLTMRQNAVKIQAHVRGHQVRKNYKKIIWSVGLLDKIILRWRRKGSGLRGFKPESGAEGGDDFFKEGRKQTEQRLQKALARVKSMVQYPEARDQYSRLLNVVNDIQESKVVESSADIDEDLIDIDALLGDDDLFMEETI